MLTAHLCSVLCWVYLLFLPLFSVPLRIPSSCVLRLYAILRLPGLFTILQTEVLSTIPHTTGLSIHHSRNICFEYQCRCILVLCTILRTHSFVYTLTFTYIIYLYLFTFIIYLCLSTILLTAGLSTLLLFRLPYCLPLFRLPFYLPLFNLPFGLALFCPSTVQRITVLLHKPLPSPLSLLARRREEQLH